MRTSITTACFLILAVLRSAAQKIESILDHFASNYPFEKTFIHSDKEIYLPGETVWFKAYLFTDNRPSNISTNFFLSLVNDKGEVLSSKKYPIVGSTAKGNIDLPDSILQGNYYIKAFTPCMFNYDDPVIYTKKIIVLRSSTQPDAATTRPAQNISIQFFPESGHLVAGISTVIAFKATDQWGNPIAIKGTIKTNDGLAVASFSSYHDGIGKIQLQPLAGEKYIAELITPAGLPKKTFPLPAVMNSGINLKVYDEENGKAFEIERSGDKEQLYNPLILVVTSNNRVVYENQIAFDDYPLIKGGLITDSVPSGILHFTVFDKNRVPLAERLSFVDNGEYRSDAEVKIVKKGTGKREENIIDISFPDQSDRSCSVSVIDPWYTSNSYQENIYSTLLLSSDLRGKINNPAWYFEKKNDSTAEALDNLMLTHGWTRYNWINILAGKFPEKKFTEEYYIRVVGTLVLEKDKAIAGEGNLKMYVSTEDSTVFLYDVPVSENGKFILDSIFFSGRSRIFYFYTDKKGRQKTVTALLDSSSYPQPSFVKEPINFEPLQIRNTSGILPANQLVLKGNENAKLLENVTVTSTAKTPFEILNEKYTSPLFRTGSKYEIDLVNENKYRTGGGRGIVIDFIKNRLPMISFTGGMFINLRYNGNPVGVFINEAPAVPMQVNQLRLEQIALVKFFNPGFVGMGSDMGGGAIAIYTKKYEAYEEESKATFFIYSGYSVKKEFFSPDYAVLGEGAVIKDNRTTLYWNPALATNPENNSMRVRFYNNDLSKRFRVIIEGFDTKGRLIHIDKIINE